MAKSTKPKVEKIISTYQVRENHTIINTDINYKKLIQSKLKGHAKASSRSRT